MKHKGWFALGLIGIGIVVGGAFAISISSMMILSAQRSVYSSVESALLMHLLYSEIDGELLEIFLGNMYASVQQLDRVRAFFRIPYYLGLCLCAIGGILSAFGWLEYIRPRKRSRRIPIHSAGIRVLPAVAVSDRRSLE